MKSWFLERGLWALAVAAIATMAGQALASSKPRAPGENPLPAMHGVLMYDASQLLDAADSITATDPFRLDRHPARPGDGRSPVGSPSPELAPVLRLQLSGVSGGPPWRAIMSGIPGRDGGVVVNTGDTLGGIKVRTIRRDTVIVQTKDSAITFTLSR